MEASSVTPTKYISMRGESPCCEYLSNAPSRNSRSTKTCTTSCHFRPLQRLQSLLSMHPAAISSLISILWQCSLSVTRRAICIRQFTVDLTKKLDLQIGERVYRVHKYFLIRESSFFRDMFSLPQ